DVVRYVLEHIEQGNEVVRIAFEHRQVGQARVLDVLPQPLARERPRAAIELARVDAAELPQHRQIVAGAAADLQHLGLLTRTDHARYDLIEDPAPREEPPMLLIEL